METRRREGGRYPYPCVRSSDSLYGRQQGRGTVSLGVKEIKEIDLSPFVRIELLEIQ